MLGGGAAAKWKAEPIDIRADLISGDVEKQKAAVVSAIGTLSEGRDVTNQVALVCQTLLGNANVDPTVKCLAYDVASMAPLSDAGGRVSGRVGMVGG
jgi:hypothetical protein